MSQEVVLHVYDLSQGIASAMSMAILGRQIDGIWHTGIHVFGREYYFGGGSALGGISSGQSGITNSTPREFQTMTGFGPTRTIRLGTTTKTRAEFEAYLRTITPNWTCGSYSLLTHNCNNFSDTVSQYLVGKRIPSYITSLPRDVASTPMGQQLLSHIQQQFGPVATSLFGDLSAPQRPSPAPAVAAPSTPAPAPATTASPAPAPTPKSIQPAVLKSPMGQVTYPEHSAVPAAVRRLLNISDNQKSNSLSQVDKDKVLKLLVTLQNSNSSNGLDTAALELLHRLATQWHSRALFPSLYLLRLLLMNKQEGEPTPQIRAVVQYLTTGLSAGAISDILLTQVLQALCNASKNHLLSGAEAQAVSLAVLHTVSTVVPLRQAALALLHNISFGLVASKGSGGSPTLFQTIMKAAATGLGEEQDSLCKQLRLASLGLLLAIRSRHHAHCVSEVRELGLQALARTAASCSKCKEEREAAGFLFIQATKYSAATKKI